MGITGPQRKGAAKEHLEERAGKRNVASRTSGRKWRHKTELDGEEWCVTYVPLGASYKASSHNYTPSTMLCVQLTTIFLTNNRLPLNLVNVSH